MIDVFTQVKECPWDQKLTSYKSNGVMALDRDGPNGTLPITKDGLDGSTSSAGIEDLIDKVLG